MVLSFFNLAPTKITSSTSSCIDHLMYQNIVNPNSEVLSFQSFSDHFPVVLTWSFKTESSHNPTVFHNYSCLKYSESFVCYVEALICELSKDMKYISLESCANDAFNTFNSCFTRVLNQFAPLIRASNAAKSNSPVWLNNRLKNLSSKKNKVHRHWKQTRDQTSFNKFQKLHSTFEAELKKSKKHFYT